MRLTAETVPIRDLGGGERDHMFALMDAHYDGVCRERFDADLREKQWVILIRESAGGSLCGFSTQMLFRVGTVSFLFSGDTIIDRDHWGDSALAGAWGRLALQLIDAADGPLWWFLASKGYKTFRFLPVFFREFYPHPERPTPPTVQGLIDAAAAHKFGRRYDAAAGVVRASADRLRPGIAEITAERLRDPYVHFFAERNPGHARGDELCCLAPLTRDNFTSAAWRVIRAAGG